MTDADPGGTKQRAGSFGLVASQYERFRPGPPTDAVDWMLPHRIGTAVDLGAGTGALTRLLISRAEEVIAVEPDDRMRSQLTAAVPGVRAIDGRGESMPLPDGCADAVLASSSWHWMDPIPALLEVGRVLVPGGTFAAVWSGPDREGPFLVQAQALLAERTPHHPGSGADGERRDPSGHGLADLVMGQAAQTRMNLEIPPGVPFDQPEHEVFTWDIALDADELIGLLGTFSWIITMTDDTRAAVFAEARRLLRDGLGIDGDMTVDVAFRADAWRSRRHD